MNLLLLSAATAAAILVTTTRFIGIKNVIKYGVMVDVIATAFLCFVFAGTFIGMSIAICAGLIIAVTLSIAKRVYKMLERSGKVTPLQKVKVVKTKRRISISFPALPKLKRA